MKCFVILFIFSSRPAAMGQTCGQLWRPVLICHQWGNCIHVSLQLGCSSVLSHQHRHPETRQAALDYPHTTAWQGCPGWDWMEISIEYTVEDKVSYVVHLYSISSLQKKCNPSEVHTALVPVIFVDMAAVGLSVWKLVEIRKGHVHGVVVPQFSS